MDKHEEEKEEIQQLILKLQREKEAMERAGNYGKKCRELHTRLLELGRKLEGM